MTRLARLLLVSLSVAAPALAVQPPPTLQPGDPNDPVETLGRYLRILSTAPKDLNALTGAGRAALEVGDANAALGFFARAEEVAPRDGRVKAGIGSALVQMEKPKEALRLFAQATDLGIPAASLAADRGLAYDLRGDNRRAQADYALALRTSPSDETVRRLALSQAMSGDRAAALATLDPLLRRQDRAAWRASTFVLALTGDARDATERLALLVSPPQAAAMAPFLGRLAALKPAEQAEAVHFGHLPSTGRPAEPPTMLAAAQPAPGAASDAAPPNLAARRRPGSGDAATPVAPATASVQPTAPVPRPAPQPTVAAPTTLASVGPSSAPAASGTPAVTADTSSATPVTALSPLPGTGVAAARDAAPTPAITPTPAPVTPSAEFAQAAGLIGPVDPRFPAPTPPPLQTARAEPPPPAVAPEAREPVLAPVERRTVEAPVAAPVVRTRVRDTNAAEAAGREDETTSAKARRGGATKQASRDEPDGGKDKRDADAASAKAKRAAEAKAEREKKLADAAKAARDKRAAADAKEKADKAKLAAAAKKAPQRYWVQVATGAYKADLPKSWANVKAKYPQLMAGRSAWTTPLRFTNRVLVGPFRSAEEAQAFVNTAGKAGFGTSPFASPPGQAVERLTGK